MLADADAPRQHVLRPLLGGKAQIWKSLHTSNYDVAKLRSLFRVVFRRTKNLKQRFLRSSNRICTRAIPTRVEG